MMHVFIRAFAVFGFAIASAIAIAAASLAAAYPDHPVRLVVPSLAGGGTDTTTRIIAPKLAEYLGQQIVIDNRGGMSGNLGAELASRAAPDGYTLLATFASHASNPAVIKNTPYDLERDFAPISMTVIVPNLLYSHPSLPAKNVKELIAFARTRPGQLSYASAGVGSTSHLAMELFLSMTGLKMLHVPYKGASQAAIDVMAGHLPMTFGNIMNALPHTKTGRIRALGVTSAKRVSAAADIPTIAEAGLPGYEAVQWYGLLAPAGTARDIVLKLHAGVVKALQDAAVKKRFIDDGAEPAASASPEDFSALIRAEIAKWAKVVKAAGIQPE
jgi:tripartite-type tricarboxylate transporter receptor subunit TctC